MRVALVDPPAYTPPYDQALAAALAAQGHDVELFTSRFAYGAVSPAGGHAVRELFYRHAVGRPGSRLGRALKLAAHGPDMARLRRRTADHDVVHFQWLPVPALDRFLLPDRPLVLTAHDLLPREPRPGQLRAQRRLLERMSAVIVHSARGRERLLAGTGLAPEAVHVVPHGAFAHLAALPAAPLPPELTADERPVVLFFGLLRPYKGIETLLEAWRGVEEAQLWIVGHPRMPLEPLRGRAPRGVTFVPRFVSDAELAACFRRARLAVLPYTRTERFDQSGVLATALAFGCPVIASDIGGFEEVAAAGAVRLVAPGDAAGLRAAIAALVADPAELRALSERARTAAAGPFSWERAATLTAGVYRAAIAREGA